MIKTKVLQGDSMKLSMMFIAGLLVATVSNFTVYAKKNTGYSCVQQRQAGNAKTMTTFMNSMADLGYEFNHWDSQNYVMCFKK